MQKIVNGVAVDLTDAEVAQRTAEEAAWTAGANARSNAVIVDQIMALESKQARAIREVALGGDATRLRALDAQIATLRGQLR